jgi:hypothetical protein
LFNANSAIFQKVQVYLWLGLSKHKKDFLNGLPGGYEQNKLVQIANKPQGVPPPFIHFIGKIKQLPLKHIYQHIMLWSNSVFFI